MFKDFRDLLDRLEKAGMLLRVKKEVDVKYEIAAGIRKVSDTDGPALLFENVRGYPNWRVAAGLFATEKLTAFALETEPDDIKLRQRYLDYDQKRVKPRLVPTGPCKEIILKGDEIDLTKLPILTHCEKDGGAYITSGVEIAKHPDTGIRNVSIHRRALLSKNTTGLLATVPQQLGMLIAVAEAKGQPLEVATAIGCNPALTLASQVKAPLGVDETEIAGGFMGEPLDLVKCETIDLEVPADAEIIIEGKIIPGERVVEGPFGEVPGDYMTMGGTSIWHVNLVQVTAITMRKNPIYHAVLTGFPMTENQWLKKWAISATCYRRAVEVVPDPADIRGINITAAGGAQRQAIIAINKRLERTPKDIIYAMLAFRSFHNVIVVDDDIDIYSDSDMAWVMNTRVDAGKDIIVRPSSSIAGGLYTAHPAWGIDATAPLEDREFYAKALVPGVDKVDYV